MENTQDPRETGTGGLTGLKGIGASQEPQYGTIPTHRRGDADYMRAKVISDEANIPTVQAIGGQEGLGDSRYDKEINTSSQLNNLNETRAQIQPALDKFGAGIGKMAGLTVTTFVNNTLGVLAGLGSLAMGDSYWDNSVNRAMDDINKSMEESLPNYYSEAEKNSPWYNRLTTANFWADGVIKNAGYAIGSVASAALTGGALSGALTGIAKVTAAGIKSLEAAAKVGVASSKVARVSNNIMKGTLKGINTGVTSKAATVSKTILNTLAMSSGEASMEALNTSNEFFNSSKMYIDKKYEDDLSSYTKDIEEQVIRMSMDENPKVLVTYYDGGVMYLSKEEALKVLAEKITLKKMDLEKERESNLAKAVELSKASGNLVFGTELALLSTTNFAQFSRVIKGGYSSAFAEKALKLVDKSGAKLASKDAAAAILKGEAKVVANKGIGGTIAKKISKNFLAEGMEEGSQNLISNTAQIDASAKLNTFAGAKLNPYVEDEVTGIMSAGIQALDEQFGSVDAPGWEEFVIGGITGLLSIPSVGKRKSGKTGVTFNGGIQEAIKEAKDAFAANTIVDKVNQRLQSPEFLNLYQGAIRRGTYQQIMEKAVEEDNELAYSTSESKQILSDALMFKKAGIIDTFYESLEELSDLSEQGIAELRKEFIEENGQSIYDGKTDEEIVTETKQRVKKIKEATKTALSMHEFHKATLGNVFNDTQLEELTYLNYMATTLDGRSTEYAKTFVEKIVPLLNSVGIETITIKDPKEKDAEGNPINKEINISEIAKTSPKQLALAFTSNEKILLPDGTESTLQDYFIGTLAKNFTKEESANMSKELKNLKNSNVMSVEAIAKALEFITKKGEETQRLNTQELREVQKAAVSAATAFIQSQDYIKQYSKALEDPKSLISKLNEADVAAQVEVENKATAEEIEAINETTTVEELGKVIEKLPEDRQLTALENVTPENSSEDLVKNAQELLKLKKLEKSLLDILETKIDTKRYSLIAMDTAKEELQKVIKKSLTEEEALKTLSNSPNTLTQELLNIHYSRLGISDSVNNNNEAQNVPEVPSASSIPTSEEVEKFEVVATIGEEDGVINTEKGTQEQDEKLNSIEENTNSISKDRTTHKLDPNTVMANTTEAVLSSKKAQRIGIEEGVYIPLPELDPKYAKTYQKLLEFGAFQYMNSGKLGTKLQEAQKSGKPLKVYFLRDRAFVNADPTHRDDLVYMVVEDSEGTVKINGKTYQVIGDLKTTALYAASKNDKNPVAMDVVNRVKEAAKTSTEDLFISEDISLDLVGITAGRLAIQSSTVVTTSNGMRTLSQTDFFELPKLGYVKNGEFIAPGLPKGSYSEPNNTTTGNLEGAIFAMVKAPNGQYIPLGMHTKVYNDTEFPVDRYNPTPLDTEIVKILNKILGERFLGANGIESKYGNELLKWLYFGRSTEGYFIRPILFKNEDGSIELVIKGMDSSTSALTKDSNIAKIILFDGTNQVVDSKTLFEFIRSLNPKIQVDSKALSKTDRNQYVKTLLDSGAFYTGLAYMHTVNASPILGIAKIPVPNTVDSVPVKKDSVSESGDTKIEIYTFNDKENNIIGDFKVITDSNGIVQTVLQDNVIITSPPILSVILLKIEMQKGVSGIIGKENTLYFNPTAPENFKGALVDNTTGRILIISLDKYNELKNKYEASLQKKKLEEAPLITEEKIESIIAEKEELEKSTEFIEKEEKPIDVNSLGVLGVRNEGNSLDNPEIFPIFAKDGNISNIKDKKILIIALNTKGITVRNKYSNESLGNTIVEALISKGIVSSITEFNERFTTLDSILQVINCKL